MNLSARWRLPATRALLGTRALLATWVVSSAAGCLGVREVQGQELPRDLPRVLIIATGGTIAGRAEGGQLTGAEIIAAVPGLAEVAAVEVEEFSRIGSSAMTPDHWLRLSRRVNEIFSSDAGVAGIVIMHGTDTMEETAYFLHLTVTTSRPVVVVGSMRNASAVSPDGPANVLSGVRTAVSPESSGRGVLVVLNDQIHSARDVRKTDNNRVETFASAEWGALGVVDADRLLYRRAISTRHTTTSEVQLDASVTELPRVPIVIDFAGTDASSVRAFADTDVAAVVVQAFGGGRASPAMREAIEVLANAEIPVVMASRVPEGRVMRSAAALDRGILAAGDLPPHKVRVLLMLALTRERDSMELQRLLDTH
jgi:L-asparaginase